MLTSNSYMSQLLLVLSRFRHTYESGAVVTTNGVIPDSGRGSWASAGATRSNGATVRTSSSALDEDVRVPSDGGAPVGMSTPGGQGLPAR
jgi:hypothetical protein